MSVNARTKFLALLAQNGWTLDPTETLRRLKQRATNSMDAVYDEVQNPYAYVNGPWHIVLDYSVMNGYSTSTGNVLRRVTMHHMPVGGESRVIGVLRNTNVANWRRTVSDLFEVTGRDTDGDIFYDSKGEPLSLRERAEKLVRDPALTAWLALENEHQRKLREAAASEEQRRETAERARPLPVTVDQENYGSAWKTLARKLADAAQAINQANGQSDLPALIAKVDEALGEVIQVLTPEARAALDELLAPDYTAVGVVHYGE